MKDFYNPVNALKYATFALAMLLTGCASTMSTDPATGIDQAGGRIHARTGFITALAEHALKAATIEAAKPHLDEIKTQAGLIDHDQTEVGRLMADERKASKAENDGLRKDLEAANAKPFYLVKLFGGLFGLAGLVVGGYFAFSGKVWLDGGALMLAGAISLGVALAIAHFGWLIALLIVVALAAVGIPIVTNATRRMKLAAVSIAEGNRKLQIANKMDIDSDAAELLNETQTTLAKRYVDVVTNKVKKSKAGK